MRNTNISVTRLLLRQLELVDQFQPEPSLYALLYDAAGSTKRHLAVRCKTHGGQKPLLSHKRSMAFSLMFLTVVREILCCAQKKSLNLAFAIGSRQSPTMPCALFLFLLFCRTPVFCPNCLIGDCQHVPLCILCKYAKNHRPF